MVVIREYRRRRNVFWPDARSLELSDIDDTTLSGRGSNLANDSSSEQSSPRMSVAESLMDRGPPPMRLHHYGAATPSSMSAIVTPKINKRSGKQATFRTGEGAGTEAHLHHLRCLGRDVQLAKILAATGRPRSTRSRWQCETRS